MLWIAASELWNQGTAGISLRVLFVSHTHSGFAVEVPMFPWSSFQRRPKGNQPFEGVLNFENPFKNEYVCFWRAAGSNQKGNPPFLRPLAVGQKWVQMEPW